MYPKVNQNIYIEIKGYDQSCRSLVAEIGKNEMLIGFPLDKNMIGLLTEGTKVDIIYMVDEYKYEFQAVILGRKTDNIPLCRITKPLEKEISKIQRRDNFRVNSNLSLILNKNKLTTINISAGGMLVTCGKEVQLEEGEMVTGSLLVPNGQNKDEALIPFQGQIIRVNLVKDDDRKNIALKFTVMDKKDQMKIVQHCFEKQRQIRLKTR